MLGQEVYQAGLETDYIGVVACKFLVVTYFYAVYGTDSAGGFIQFVQKWYDTFLMGNGDVDAFQVWVLRAQFWEISDVFQWKQLITGVFDVFTGEFFRKKGFRKGVGEWPADECVEVSDER